MSEGAPSSSSLQPEELLAHATWVQRLARSLVAGEDRADDVAQETWLHALRAPPADRSDLRRWLTRVAQNVARKLARGDERRERRESRAPSPSPLPTPEEAFERAALQRRVVDAVLALDETYRAALLLRFFEDLPPSDVARALGIPVETARTRIKRGLELVRARFASPNAALAPLLMGTHAGVAIMTATVWKLGVAAAVVAAAAWWVLREDAAKQELPTPVAAASTPPPAEVVASPVVSDATRASASSETEVGVGRVLLHGFVVDHAGSLLPTCSIQWDDPDAPPVSGGRHPRAAAAQDGEYAIPPLTRRVVNFNLKSAGYQPLAVALDLTKSDAVQRHDFVMTKSYLIPFRIVTPDGEPLFGDARPPDGVLTELDWGLAVVASESPLPPSLPPSNFARLDGVGIGRMSRRHGSGGRGEAPIPDGMEGVVDVPRLPVELSLLMKNAVVQRHPVTSGDQVVTFTIDPTALEAHMGRVIGRFVDARSGTPVETLNVGLGDLSRGGGGRKVGADGRFELGPVAPGFLHLDVHPLGSPNSFEGYRRWLHVEPGKTLDLGDIALGPAITLKGTVLDSEGKPVTTMVRVLRQDLLVHGHPFGSNFFHGMDEPGTLAIWDLGRHRYALVAGADGVGDSAIAVVDIVGPEPAPITMRLEPLVDVKFVTDTKGEERLTGELSTAGAVFEASRWRTPHSTRLVPGKYALSLYRESTLVRTVSFEVGRDPIQVAFSVDDSGPAVVTPADLAAAATPPAPTAVAEVREPAIGAGKHEPMLLVSGRILDQAGVPLKQASVTLTDTLARRRSGSVAPDGTFAVAGLHPGRKDLVARAEGCRESHLSIELLPDDVMRHVEITIERMSRVKVKLVDTKGEPIEKALSARFREHIDESQVQVVATFEEPPEHFPSDALSRFGRWQAADAFRNETAGTLEIDEPLPVFVSAVFAGQVLACEAVEEGNDEITLVLDLAKLESSLASVRFRLVDAATREPFLRAGAKLLASNSHADPPLQDLSADSDGVWRFERQLPGPRNLCIKVEGIEFGVAFEVELDAGRSNDLGDLELLLGAELRVRVVDEDGRPVKTHVSVQPDRESGFRSRTSFGDSTGEDGTLRISVPFPRVQLSVGRDWVFEDPRVVDLVTAGDTEVVLVARRGTLVTLRPPPGTRDAARVTVTRGDGLTVFASVIRGAVPRQVQLLPGTYRLVVERDGVAPRESSFVVADAPVEVPLGG